MLRVTFFPHPEMQTNLKLGADSGTQLAPSRHPVESIELNLGDDLIKLLVYCQQPKLFSEIIQEMGWSDRTKFRRKFLHPLLEKNMLEVTIPETPHSPNQRYVTTLMGKKIIHKE